LTCAEDYAFQGDFEGAQPRLGEATHSITRRPGGQFREVCAGGRDLRTRGCAAATSADNGDELCESRAPRSACREKRAWWPTDEMLAKIASGVRWRNTSSCAESRPNLQQAAP
jgi:hypothetical protein